MGEQERERKKKTEDKGVGKRGRRSRKVRRWRQEKGARDR